MAEQFVYRIVGIDLEDGDEKRDEHGMCDSHEAAARAAYELLHNTDPSFDRVVVERRAVPRWSTS